MVRREPIPSSDRTLPVSRTETPGDPETHRSVLEPQLALPRRDAGARFRRTGKSSTLGRRMSPKPPRSAAGSRSRKHSIWPGSLKRPRCRPARRLKLEDVLGYRARVLKIGPLLRAKGIVFDPLREPGDQLEQALRPRPRVRTARRSCARAGSVYGLDPRRPSSTTSACERPTGGTALRSSRRCRPRA
jgi:hypothetical protein